MKRINFILLMFVTLVSQAQDTLTKAQAYDYKIGDTFFYRETIQTFNGSNIKYYQDIVDAIQETTDQKIITFTRVRGKYDTTSYEFTINKTDLSSTVFDVGSGYIISDSSVHKLYEDIAVNSISYDGDLSGIEEPESHTNMYAKGLGVVYSNSGYLGGTEKKELLYYAKSDDTWFGTSFLRYNEAYDFEIGDVFEYQTTTYNGDENAIVTTSKETVEEIIENETSLAYKFKVEDMNGGISYSTLTILNENLQKRICENLEPTEFFNSFSEESYKNLDLLTNHVSSIPDPILDDPQYDKIFVKGLGLVYFQESEVSYNRVRKLIAYQKGNETWEMKETATHPIQDLSPCNIVNPVSNKTLLINGSSNNPTTLAIHGMDGVIILETIIDSDRVSLNLAHLHSGIYIVTTDFCISRIVLD